MPAPLLTQIRDFLLATCGLALIFGVPVIIIRAFNTRGEKKQRKGG